MNIYFDIINFFRDFISQGSKVVNYLFTPADFGILGSITPIYIFMPMTLVVVFGIMIVKLFI